MFAEAHAKAGDHEEAAEAFKKGERAPAKTTEVATENSSHYDDHPSKVHEADKD